MRLFGRRQEEENSGNPNAPVKVLGMGCAACKALEETTRQAMEELGQMDGLEYVTDPVRIAAAEDAGSLERTSNLKLAWMPCS